MKTIEITEILEYYDGIQTFAARDPIGGHYVGQMTETVGDHDRYAVVGVRPKRLKDLRAGKVDLRTLLLETPAGQWYTMMPEGEVDDPQELIPQSTPLAQSDWLPQDGYFIGPEEPPDGGAIRRALNHGKVVTLTGLVEQADRSVGEWALLTEDGIQSGKTYPGGPCLDGLQVGERYRFKCAQVTGLDSLWRNKQTLYLHHVEHV